MDFDFGVIVEYLPLLLEGALMTVLVSGLSLIIATVLGIFVALLRISRLRVVRGITATYLWVMRGTPLLLVLFFIYYALPRLGISLPALVAAVVAMSLNATAYNAEIFRAGIQAISKGQTDAAHAIGMGYGKLMRRIILPQAARIVIPPYINNAILLVKNSALVSTITVADLMLNATQVVSSTFKALEIFSVAGVLYLTMTSALMLLQIWSERKFAYYVR
jgi:His/Glu/Gln/Arg/opine family amino acid ABC transporter permease subunit